MASPQDYTTRNEQITLLPAYQEEYLKDLLSNAQSLSGTSMNIPQRQVAGFAPGQQSAFQLGYGGIGSYQPMMQAGADTISEGIGGYKQAMGIGSSGIPLYQAGAQALRGSMGQFDPGAMDAEGNTAVSKFMDPYTDAVIKQSEADLMRQNKMFGNKLSANTVGQGAFGGSRGAVAQGQLNRDTADQMARTSSGLRSQGYQQALQGAQSAFGNQANRQQNAASLFGSLGSAYGQTGQGLGSLAGGLTSAGMNQASLGEGFQGAQGRDVNMLLGLGGMEQQYNQTGLDAYRQDIMDRNRQPYQNLAFMGDIFRGVPSTQSTYGGTYQAPPSAMSGLAGAGVQLAGLNRTNLFN
tara:strand:+ start:2120 stop:3175 length:1056 start_codon:yes stop_codon:yes gene_type:complete